MAAGGKQDGDRTGHVQRRRPDRHAQLLGEQRRRLWQRQCGSGRQLDLHGQRCRSGRSSGGGRDAVRQHHRPGCRQQWRLCHPVVNITITGPTTPPVITSAAQTGKFRKAMGCRRKQDGDRTGHVQRRPTLTDTHSFSVSSRRRYGSASVDQAATGPTRSAMPGRFDLWRGRDAVRQHHRPGADNNGGFATQVVNITITAPTTCR